MRLKVLAAPACYIISDETGSDPTAIYELIYSLSLNYNVGFYAITNRAKVRNPLPKIVKLIELRTEHGGSLVRQAAFVLKYYREARRIVKEDKPDILHHMSPPPFGGTFNPLIVFDKVDLPFILGPAMHNVPLSPELLEDLKLMRFGHSWGDLKSNFEVARDQMLSNLFSMFKSLINGWFLETVEKADVIITVNNFTRRAYEKVTSSKKIRVIPYGVNPKKFPYSPPPRSYEIVTLGGLYKRRGIHHLIEAMPEIVGEFHEVRLHIVGDGPQKASLLKLSKMLGVDDHIVFHGLVPHYRASDLYRAYRIVVLPTLHECFGLVILEGMSSGRPVVVTDAVGPREIVVDGKTGYIVPMKDPNALADAICRLLGDYDLCHRMGLEGRRLVEEKYDWKIIAGQYHKIYEKLAHAD